MKDNYNNGFEEECFLPGRDRKNPFVVPAGYFEQLPQRIVVKIEIEEELKEFNLLSSFNRKLMFAVPLNYFRDSENLFEYQHELSALKMLSAIRHLRPENVEPDYFASLEDKILNRLKQADELKEYETLYAIDKKNNFAVSPDYFDTVADRVKEKYHAAGRPRVSLPDQILRFLLSPKVAVSFTVLLIIGFAAIRNANRVDPVITPGDCKTLACLEKNELLNEQNARDFDEENLYEMVDVELLDKQLSEETTDSVVVNKAAADSIEKNQRVNELE